MDKAYKYTGYFFILLFVIVICGFFKTYFGLFPEFNRVDNVLHFHGILLFFWFVLLIVQPFLVKQGNYKLHRMIGKIAYLLAPLLVISIFLVSKYKFHRLSTLVSMEENNAQLLLNIASMGYFSFLFSLAMYYKNRREYHMRFMIATALLLFGPGIGRVFENFAGLSFSLSVALSVLITEIITFLLIMYDIRTKQAYMPYLATLCLLIVFHIIWAMRYTEPLQVVSGGFAEKFF